MVNPRCFFAITNTGYIQAKADPPSPLEAQCGSKMYGLSSVVSRDMQEFFHGLGFLG